MTLTQKIDVKNTKARADGEASHNKYLKGPQLWLNQEQMVETLVLGQMVASAQALQER